MLRDARGEVVKFKAKSQRNIDKNKNNNVVELYHLVLRGASVAECCL